MKRREELVFLKILFLYEHHDLGIMHTQSQRVVLLKKRITTSVNT